MKSTKLSYRSLQIKSIVLFVFLLVALKGSAQHEFGLDTIYLKNKDISMVSYGYNGEAWCVEDQDSTQKLYQIDIYGNVIDKTSDFQTIIQHTITDIVCVNSNALLIGTESDYLHYYNNGTFYKFDETYGIESSSKRVNSIFYDCDRKQSYGEEVVTREKVLVATNGKMYSKTSLLGQFEEFSPYDHENNNIFYSHDDYIIYHITYGGGKELAYNNLSYFTTMGKFDYYTYGEVLCANYGFYDTGRLKAALVGTEKGFETWTTYYKSRFRFLESQCVYGAVSLDEDFLIAADSGVYYHSMSLGLPPQKIDIGYEKVRAKDVVQNNGTYLVATDSGLVKIVEANCDYYKNTFLQSQKYLDVNSDDSIILQSTNFAGTKTFNWNFGDSTSATGIVTSHRYEKPGLYQISLTTSNAYCTNQSTSKVTVFSGNEFNSIEFKPNYDLPFNELQDASAYQFVDMNGDNKSEIAIRSSGVFEIDTTGGFSLNNLDLGDGMVTNLLDFNNDGLNDYIFAAGRPYKNLGNFEFVELDWIGSINKKNYIDFNNDGYVDIVCTEDDKLTVHINNGDFTFSKEEFNDIRISNIETIRFFDINGDNKNDIFITTPSRAYAYLFTNGKYVQFNSSELNIERIENYCVGDLDNDLLPEFFFDTGSQNILLSFKNNQFEKIDLTWLTNETDFPIYISDINFVDAGFCDLDNNGFLDCVKLHKTNSRTFLNFGDMVFVNDGENSFSQLENYYPERLLLADINFDGSNDIVWGDDNRMLFNNTKENNWVKFKLFGTQSNINAIGAKVVVKSSRGNYCLQQTRSVEVKTNERVQEGYTIHFGLDSLTRVDSLFVYWPSGVHSTYTNLQANRTYNIVEPSYRYIGDTVFCANEKFQFTMPKVENLTYDWYHEGILIKENSTDLVPHTSGAYYCTINNGLFVDTSYLINITVKPVEDAHIEFASGDAYFCPEDSLLISSEYSEFYNYQWFVDGRKIVNDSNLYYVCFESQIHQILQNQEGCYDTSNVLYSSYYPVPEITHTDSLGYCQLDSAGITQPYNYTYLWSTGDTSNTVFVNSEQVLWVNAWNEFGCLSQDTTVVFERPLPQVNIGPADTSIYYHERFIPLHECNFNYSYLWNDSLTVCSRLLQGSDLNLGEHVISLIATDKYGCQGIDSILLKVIMSDNTDVSFPNPANTFVNIVITDEMLGNEVEVQFFNLSGKLSDEYNVSVTESQVLPLNVSQLESGLYVLKIKYNDDVKTSKVLIQH